jgi:hypothetical protein
MTLERGVTHDLEFEPWINNVWRLGSSLGSEAFLADFLTKRVALFWRALFWRHCSGALPGCTATLAEASSRLDANPS